MTAVTVQAGGCRSVIPVGRQFDAQIFAVASVAIVELGTEIWGKSEGRVVDVRIGFPDRFIGGCEDLAPSRLVLDRSTDGDVEAPLKLQGSCAGRPADPRGAQPGQ